MKEYTKGEWRADIKSGCVVSDAGMICDVGFVNVHPEANAHLIAAAPNLLEACKMALDFVGTTAEAEKMGIKPVAVTKILESAIAKAKT